MDREDIAAEVEPLLRKPPPGRARRRETTADNAEPTRAGLRPDGVRASSGRGDGRE